MIFAFVFMTFPSVNTFANTTSKQPNVTNSVVSQEEYEKIGSDILENTPEQEEQLKQKFREYNQQLSKSSSTIYAIGAGMVTGTGNEKRYYTSDFEQFKYGNNCGPTAASNILSYFKTVRNVNLYSGNITQSVYNTICKDCSYTGSEGISLNMAAQGIKQFTKRAGKTAVIDKYWLNTWGDITRDIDANKPALLGWNEHMWVVLGYTEVDGERKLFVSTGWSNDPHGFLPFTSGMEMQSVNIY